MSLLDALLLDPAPLEIWISQRTDLNRGSGTPSDPYDGSTADRFDAAMNLAAALPAGTTVHLGPGTFMTRGYPVAEGRGWQPKAPMRILGAGVDVTTLQLVDATTTGEHYYAIGHNLADRMDFVEVADLTIDCNQPSNFSSACGAVRLLGNHVRIGRVKAKNWGNRTTKTAFVFSVVAGYADGNAVANDAGLEDCIAVDPATSTTKDILILHAGYEEPLTPPPDPPKEVFGQGPYIRQCFVDCNDPGTGGGTHLAYLHALSITSCRGGIVEGNQIHNVRDGGPYLQNWSARSVVIRNNTYKNVAYGPHFETLPVGHTLAIASIARLDTYPLLAEATLNGTPHPLVPGDRVKITGATRVEFNGVFILTEVSQIDSTYKFKYLLAQDPGPNVTATGASMEKVIAVEKLVIENNVLELAPAYPSVVSIAIKISAPTSAAVAPEYGWGDVIIRNNKIRYLDGFFIPDSSGYALDVTGARNLLVQHNILECAPQHPLQNKTCGQVSYLNNRTPAGALIQGYNGDTSTKYSELETEAEDALLLTLI